MEKVIDMLASRRRTNAAVLMARLVDRQGALLGRAVLRSIDFVVVAIADERGETHPIACAAVEPNEVVLNGLRNDNGWSVDAIGYNFCHRFDLNSLNLPRDAAGCEIRYVVQDVNGEISVVCFRVRIAEHD
jgi:hypothetical protein